VFSMLSPLMDKPGETGMYAAAVAALGMTENNLKVTLNRMRQRLRSLMEEMVEDTVRSAQETQEELRYLFRALSHSP